ncbi:hypothetical protein GF312_22890 [Candidatus Poribacteria bacterium]|nr:hypothetical protein [Candidatus Poribacteria bacterium]
MSHSLESKALSYLHQLMSWNQEILAPHVDKDKLENKVLSQVRDKPEEVGKKHVKELEAIVLSRGRPVLFIVNGEFEEPKSLEWNKRLTSRREKIIPSIPSIGRIDLRFEDYGGFLRNTEHHIGTGFMVAPNILLTNHHVTEVFSSADGSIRSGFKPVIDFAEEHGRNPDLEHSIIRVIKIGTSLDFALLEVKPANGHSLPEPLEYVREMPEILVDGSQGTLVCTIGYPAFDSRLPAKLQARIFDGIFGVKRMAPGRLRQIQYDPLADDSSPRANELVSDYTSLGGSSGSPVIDLDSGKVIGLHYAGSYLEANYSVPIWILSDQIDKAIKAIRTPKVYFRTETSVQTTEKLEELSIESVEFIRESLRNDPDLTLAYFQGIWDSELTAGDLIGALERLKWIADNSKDGIVNEAVMESAFSAELEAAWPPSDWGKGQVKLPSNFNFSDMTDKIPIDPALSKYEEKRDAAGWIKHAAGKFIAEKIGKFNKAPFRWAEDYSSRFVYTMADPVANDGKINIGLFSDFGTGLYHSLYIALHMANWEPALDYAIHLGDVYYAGTHTEFQNNFTKPLERLIQKARLFALNANHEMLSGGFPYFQCIDDRRNKSQLHEQEGSYFCIRSDQFQIIGIDTAYHTDGRHCENKLVEWLAAQLEYKRTNGMINILLSANEPYSYKSGENSDLLIRDMDRFARDGLIDLWFWGNEHYCALYRRAEDAPFIGSCIGHGGYPYSRIDRGDVKGTLRERARFLETRPRFPESTGVRPDRGNNGFAVLSLDKKENTVTLKYIDWMREIRFITRMGRIIHGLDFLT